MEKNVSNKITKNGLLMIDELPFDKTKKQKLNIDITLQIYYVSKYVHSYDNIYSLSLMDINYKYNGFIILFDSNSSPNIGDIINIKTISFIQHDSPNKIILILKYEIIENNAELINHPREMKLIKMQSEKKDIEKEKILSPTSDNISKVKLIKKNEIKLNISNQNIQKENSLFISNHKNKNELNQNKSNEKINNTSNKEEKYNLLSTLTSFSKNIKIKVKCVKKFLIKHYVSRISGLPGKFFSMILSDQEGFEMGASCFNDSVNVIYDKIEEGKFYDIKGGYIKINDRKFFETNSDYKIIFDRNTIIEELKDIEDFKKIKCDFVKLNKLEEINNEKLINILGYVINISDIITINTKYGEKKVRRIILGDETGYKVELSLWNTFAEIDIPINHFITAKKIRINQYNSIKKLGTVNASEIIIDDKLYLKEKQEIENKLKNKNFSFKFYQENFSDYFNDYQIYFLDELIYHFEEKADEFENYKVKCYVKDLTHNDNNYYIGCDLCKKKIKDINNNVYICEFCNKVIKKPKYLYSLCFTICDSSMEYKVKMFDDLGKIFLGYSAEDYKILIKNNDVKLKEIDKNILYKEFYFILKINSNVLINRQIIDIKVIKFEKIEEKIESEKIITLLNQLIEIN